MIDYRFEKGIATKAAESLLRAGLEKYEGTTVLSASGKTFFPVEYDGASRTESGGAAQPGARLAAALLWLGAAAAIVGMAIFLPFAWDAKDYLLALQQYRAYVNGQISASLAYSPLFMIPTLGVARLLPLWLTIALFAVAYFSGWLLQLWVGMQFATPEERRILRYVAPVIAFFPGLLINDVIVSGNLAYILYGLMLAAAAFGWKRGRWFWFYLAVLAAACVKVHLLTMLAVPVLSSRRQWLRTTLTATTGLALYGLQSRIWPQAFHVYWNTLQTMSQSRRDFGCGPAGNLARVLQIMGLPYEKTCVLFYAVYAVAMFLTLLWLSRLYRDRKVCFASWAPVMLIGVVLLNPRILTYDAAAVSLPMALVAWRSLREVAPASRKKALILSAIVLLALNVFVEANEDFVTMLPDAWKYLEMVLMLGIFAAGARTLLREASNTPVPGSLESDLPSFDYAGA